MKGIVVDIKGKNAVALRKDGSFVKIRNNSSLKIGCEIEIERTPGIDKKIFVKISSIAAAFLLVLGVGYGAYSYNTPYSYVNVDINPSVEFAVNIYDTIIGVEALNDDGKKLLESKNLKNKKLEAGVLEILNKAVERGYFNNNDENAVIFTVSSKDNKKSENIKNGLNETASKEFSKDKVKSVVLIKKASLKQHKDAKQKGLSPGKLDLIENAKKENPELKLDELKKTSVKELIKRQTKIKKENQNIESKGKINENKKNINDSKNIDEKVNDESLSNKKEDNKKTKIKNNESINNKIKQDKQNGIDKKDSKDKKGSVVEPSDSKSDDLNNIDKTKSKKKVKNR